MARVPLIEKTEASPEVRGFYDRLAGWLAPQAGRRATQAAERPPQIWRVLAHSPELAEKTYEATSFVFSKMAWAQAHLRERQFLILAVIRRRACEWAYVGHWPVCERIGITRAEFDLFATLEGLEAAKSDPHFTADEQLLIAFADDLARSNEVSGARFEAVRARYGDQAAVEITAIVAYRLMTSALINAFDLKDD